ncbi:MAG: class I SAM-dependent methyltransferase [Coriobacteriia bacterium]|nr:class I SAM-dependent methyltransferase [Coriobacteriia bacterium]
MRQEIAEKVAGSLTAETTELLPYLPYLLQDFWELGSDPLAMIEMVKKHAELPEDATVLDLACGKGVVAIKIAQALGVKVKGADLIPEFIKFSQQKADEYAVGNLCDFIVADINEVVSDGTSYDLVIMGAAGDALGDPAETLRKLKGATKAGGYILLDECYLAEGSSQADVKYDNYEYLTEKQWQELFKATGLKPIETLIASELECSENLEGESAMKLITARAQELSKKYPDKKDLFEGYVQSQQDEYDDLDSNIEGVIWMLQRVD